MLAWAAVRTLWNAQGRVRISAAQLVPKKSQGVSLFELTFANGAGKDVCDLGGANVFSCQLGQLADRIRGERSPGDAQIAPLSRATRRRAGNHPRRDHALI